MVDKGWVASNCGTRVLCMPLTYEIQVQNIRQLMIYSNFTVRLWQIFHIFLNGFCKKYMKHWGKHSKHTWTNGVLKYLREGFCRWVFFIFFSLSFARNTWNIGGIKWGSKNSVSANLLFSYFELELICCKRVTCG